MFDGEAFGNQMVGIVRDFVASEPLRAENKALADRIAELEAREIIVPKDGEKGDPGTDGEPGSDGKDGKDGADCDMEAVRGLIEELVSAKVAEIPPPEKGDPGADGKDGIDGNDGEPGKDGLGIDDLAVTQDGAVVEFAFSVGETRSIFEVELPAGPPGADGIGEKGDPGPAGSLPTVQAWFAGVHYSGNVRSHAGGTWQALKDTASEPPHDDWICLAAPGANGQDGKSLNPRRLWVAEEEYFRLDVVALNGGSFVALKDEPGVCPGDGWALLTSPGKRGERGEKGDKGLRGEPGPPIVAASIDSEGMQTLVNADGSAVQCDLYPLLSRLA